MMVIVAVFAKKVKFEVDMTDVTISTYGVHVAGDFQALAGYSGGDWQPGTTEMLQETGSQIYSVIVDIPAFAKYEYKFLNGDQWYDVEFVPWESRVGYNFNDNRWIYVDSIAADTTTTHPIVYSGNAPAGLKLLRLKVDMQKESAIDPAGVHVAGSFQGWDPAIFRLYGFDTTIYEFLAFVTPGYWEYKYYNGNTPGAAETVPAECSVNGNRWANVVNDTIVEVVCYAECSACVITQVPGYLRWESIAVFPNPAKSEAIIEFKDGSETRDIVIVNCNGEAVLEFKQYRESSLNLSVAQWEKGLYMIYSQAEKKSQSAVKLIVE